MKKVIVAALLVVGLTTFAQEKEGKRNEREKLTQEQKVDFQVKRITKDLDLNEKQAKDVRNLIAKEVEKREAKRAQLKDLKDNKRDEMRAQMEAEAAAVSSDMKKILTPEQYTKWGKILEERKEKIKEKIKEKMDERR